MKTRITIGIIILATVFGMGDRREENPRTLSLGCLCSPMDT